MAELTRLEKAMDGLGKWVFIQGKRKLKLPAHLAIRKVGYTTIRTCCTESGRFFRAFETMPGFAIYHTPSGVLMCIDVSLEGAIMTAESYGDATLAADTADRCSKRTPPRYVEYEPDFFVKSELPLFSHLEKQNVE